MLDNHIRKCYLRLSLYVSKFLYILFYFILKFFYVYLYEIFTTMNKKKHYRKIKNKQAYTNIRIKNIMLHQYCGYSNAKRFLQKLNNEIFFKI